MNVATGVFRCSYEHKLNDDGVPRCPGSHGFDADAAPYIDLSAVLP